MTNHPNRSKTVKAVRAYLLAREGVERVRVASDGTVDAYGVMPNTNQTGWYFAGVLNELAREADSET